MSSILIFPVYLKILVLVQHLVNVDNSVIAGILHEVDDPFADLAIFYFFFIHYSLSRITSEKTLIPSDFLRVYIQLPLASSQYDQQTH